MVILIEHLAPCEPFSLTLTYSSYHLHSLAPLSFSPPSLIFSFNITRCHPSPFLHRPVPHSISSDVVYEKAFQFPKTICVKDATRSVPFHQSQRCRSVFKSKPKFAIEYMLIYAVTLRTNTYTHTKVHIGN